MLRWMKVTLVAAAMAVFLVQPGVTQALDEPRSAAVPLDFLKWIDRDEAWLRSELSAMSATAGYEIVDGRLESEDAGVLRAVNRIRAFAHLAAKGVRPPYFDLMLTAADGSRLRCATLFPKSIVPTIDAADFKAADFSAADAEPTILDMCRVDEAKLAEFAAMDRRALRERFFDGNGDLKTEFVDLNNNPALVAALLDEGFFVYQGDVTGRIRVAP